jgi:hypothetical protein
MVFHMEKTSIKAFIIQVLQKLEWKHISSKDVNRKWKATHVLQNKMSKGITLVGERR